MNHEDAIAKVAELLEKAHIATMTTKSGDQIVARPMAVQATEFDGDIWFFTYQDSDKVREITIDPQTNIAFESSNSWVSLSGRAELVHDREKASELWSPLLKAWFPGELDEPGLALIKVHAETAEYWDSSNSKVVSLFGTVKAAVTGQQAEGGENETVHLA